MRVTLNRWLDLFLLLAVSLGLYLIFSHQFISIFNILERYLNDWPNWMRILIRITIFTILILVLLKIRVVRIKDVNPFHVYKYPPIWTVALIATISYILLLIRFNNNFYDKTLQGLNILDILSTIILPIIGIFLLLNIFNVIGYIRNGKLSNRFGLNDKITVSSLIGDPVKFFNWIENDIPINHPSKDLFGITSIAERCARLLLQKDIKSIGINGPYGSGKSSVLKLVTHYLNTRNNRIDENTFDGKIEIITIDGWGRNEDTLDQQILSYAVETMSKYADCLAISTLPRKYKSALSGVDNSLINILSLLMFGSRDPIDSLTKLDEILIALKLRIIFYIEDVDRNVTSSVGLGSLLDRINNLSNVSFILTLGLTKDYIDTVKRVCNHVESIS